MKSSMKKLAVLMSISAIAMFTMVATASAGDDYPKVIRGQYIGTGGGTCVIALCGFDSTNAPIYGISQFDGYSGEAVFTFAPDGTGKVTETNTNVIWPSGGYPNGWAGQHLLSWNFKYKIGHDGLVTITQGPGPVYGTWASGPLNGQPPDQWTGQNRTGTITPDGLTITLTGGLPDVETMSTLKCPLPTMPTVEAQMICSYSAVLTRQY
jgi:hypothetical protein